MNGILFLIKMRRISRISIILFPLFVFAEPLTLSGPTPICGFPHVINKTGEVVIKKSLQKPASGDTSFYIYDDITASTPELIEVSFNKVKVQENIIVYAEATEMENNHVSGDDVDKIIEALLYQTPSGSINPDKGILTNEIDIFGQLPDINNDGKLLVLLTDIRDDYDADDNPVYIAGYFDPRDQIRNSGKGNFGDILYIDTNPGKIYDEFTLGIVAHELQHLIHYGTDSDESTWLNEGMSEFAMFILGFDGRSFGPFLRDTNNPLTGFDNTIADYAKVRLWTIYCYYQFGLDLIKAVHHSTTNSLESYDQALRSMVPEMGIEKVMGNWFVANLINDPNIDNGEYGYDGEQISELYSDYFYGSFEENDKIELNVKNSAAQYIRFFAGKDLRFDMEFSVSTDFNMAIVKESNSTSVEFVNLGTSPYQFSDPSFGLSYNKLTFIPYWTRYSVTEREKNISFTAHLVGGIEETEIINSGDLTYYIQLNNARAAEKIDPFNGGLYRLAGVKFNVGTDDEVTVKIYSSLYLFPVTEYELIPNSGDWTTFYLPSAINFPESDPLYISVESDESKQSLGYSATGNGNGRAYLDAGSGFTHLSNFEVNGTSLDGDWMIGGIFYSDIMVDPQLEVIPSVLKFYENEYSRQFEIHNIGGGTIDWSIDSSIPKWMSLSATTGTGLSSIQKVTVYIDRNSLQPGLYNHLLEIESSAGADSVLISVMKRNLSTAQAGLFTHNMSFSRSIIKQSMRVFHIGISGEAEFGFTSSDPAIAFSPHHGTIGINDTVTVDALIDPGNVQSALIPFQFYDGIDTLDCAFTFLDSIGEVSNKLKLFPTLPNPFVASSGKFVQIPFRLQNSDPARLRIYNIRGELIQSNRIIQPEAGFCVYAWDGKNRSGKQVSSGIYLISLEQGSRFISRKMVLLQ